jgi:hypothetical protein
MFTSLFVENEMWIVILYICVTQACGFVDSPPFSNKADCEASLANGMAILQADSTVIAFDGACVYVKMRQV